MRKGLHFNKLGDSWVLFETETIRGEYDAKGQDKIWQSLYVYQLLVRKLDMHFISLNFNTFKILGMENDIIPLIE